MTIKMLKEIIKDLPDDMRIYADDGGRGMFSDNNEFLTAITQVDNSKMCIFQTRNDFETDKELEAWCEWASENNYDEQYFWIEFYEKGYIPSDFGNKEKEEWAKINLEHYGLLD